MDEHLLIQKYFSNIGSAYLAEHNVEVSIGDDASVTSANINSQYINSIDTSILGVHFLESMTPEEIAYRACVVALSDLAACGAKPCWYSISLTFPEFNEDWLSEFSSGLNRFSEEYKIPLIGGDTTKGYLSITVQVMGQVDSGKAILRSNAKENELILVSGKIGNAFLGLKQLEENSTSKNYQDFYKSPKARIELGMELVGLATSAIDISDGLLQDLNLLCESSNIGAEIFADQIPTSSKKILVELINSGDDYELCFTAKESDIDSIQDISRKLHIPITVIGRTNSSQELVLFDESKKRMEIGSGYKHF